MTMTQPQTVVAGTLKECCQQETNLRVVESTVLLTVRRCIVCGCRHFEAQAEAGRIFAKPSA